MLYKHKEYSDHLLSLRACRSFDYISNLYFKFITSSHHLCQLCFVISILFQSSYAFSIEERLVDVAVLLKRMTKHCLCKQSSSLLTSSLHNPCWHLFVICSSLTFTSIAIVIVIAIVCQSIPLISSRVLMGFSGPGLQG